MSVGFAIAERFYLGEVPKAEKTLHFTLVVESPANFYVEIFDDSRFPSVKERVKTVQPNNFKKYEINGVRMDELIAEKFYNENFLVPEKRTQKNTSARLNSLFLKIEVRSYNDLSR